MSAAQISSDGKTIACGGWDGATLEIVDLAVGKTLRHFAADRATIPHYAFIPRQDKLAFVASALYTEYGSLSLQIGDFGGSAEPETVSLTGSPTDVAVDPSGRWIAVPTLTFEGSPNRLPRPFSVHLQVIAVASRSIHESLPVALTQRITSLGFSPDGKRLAVRRQDGEISLWDTHTWQRSRSVPSPSSPDGLSGHGGPFVFSGNSRYLAVGLGSGVSVYDLESKQKPMTVFAKSWTVWESADLSADGHTLMIGTSDGTVEFRDAQTGVVRKTWVVGPGRSAK